MALCFENELLQYLGFCQLYLVSAKVNVYDPLNYITKTNYLYFVLNGFKLMVMDFSFIKCQLSGVSSQLTPVQQLKLVTRVIPFAHKELQVLSLDRCVL